MSFINHFIQRSCKGFTLIEVLVAVIVMAIGLLGMANLQLVSTQSNFDAFQRTQAILVANAAIDRMRTNATKLDDYAANDLGGNTITSEPPGCTASEDSSTCATKMVNHDVWELERLVDNSYALVSPKVCITNNAGDVRIVVAWRGLAERVVTTQTTAGLDNCGQADIDNAFLKQVVVNTYITPGT